MSWLLKALADEMPKIETFSLCLLMNGVRRDEARLIKWAYLDLDRALRHKPPTKTGVAQTIPLPAKLMARLQQLPRITEWSFPLARTRRTACRLANGRIARNNTETH